MKQALVKAAFIASCLLIAWELIAFCLSVAAIMLGQVEVGGAPSGILVQFIGMVRSGLHGLVPPVILLIVIEIYRGRRL